MAHLVTGLVEQRSVFLAPDCPARGHRSRAALAGRCTRSATPTQDPATTHQGFGACEEDGRGAEDMLGQSSERAHSIVS